MFANAYIDMPFAQSIEGERDHAFNQAALVIKRLGWDVYPIVGSVRWYAS
jgi:hypothetical protein